MTGPDHQRVREVFRAAVAEPEQGRAAFVRAACRDEPDVAAEVLSLLEYHDPRPLLEPAALVPVDPNLDPSDYAPFRLTAADRRLAAVALVGAMLLGLAGWNWYDVTRVALQEQLQGTLQATVDATTVALEGVLSEERARVQRWAESPSSRDAARVLLSRRDGVHDDSRDSAALQELRADFAPLFVRPAFVAAALFGRDGKGVLLGDGQVIELTSGGIDLGRTVLEGHSVMIPPRAAGTYLLGHDADPNRPMLTFLAPVHLQAGATGPADAVFAVSLDANALVGAIPAQVRPGKSGGTYAFDGEGLMLSASHDEQTLREIGLLPGDAASAALHVRLGDPEVDLTADGVVSGHPTAAWPLTFMAARATAGEDGSNTEGYRDSRGVKVVGAWRWLDEWQLGIATEMDAAEALAPLRLLENGLYALLGGLLLAGAVAVLHPARLRRRLSATPRVGRYTLLRLLGVGGMGRVYLARQARLKRPVALKLVTGSQLSERTLRRFEREVQITASLSHPNTIVVFDFGRTPDGVFYYAMECLDGIDIAQLMDAEDVQPPARVIHVLRQACGSLAEAHERGLVHRDIKPSNLMLCRLGGVLDVLKVVDFGLAKDLVTPEVDPVTGTGERAGTPGYLAPECLGTPAREDGRSDLYGLGGVAYCMLTGREAFERGPGGFALMDGALPPSMEQLTGVAVPAALEALVFACLDPEPDRRPASARDLERALAEIDVEPWTQADAAPRWAGRPVPTLSIEPPGRP